jgi:AraC family transcriptional activator of pobA
MDEAVAAWYFFTMARSRHQALAAQRVRIPRVAFDRRKYGRHLLLDVAPVHQLNGFIIGAPHVLAFFEIMLVTRGSGWFSLDAERHRVRPGTVLFTTPGQVRQWDTKQLDGICLFFEDSFLNDFLHDDSFLNRLPYFHVDAARAVLRLGASSTRGLRSRLTAMQREVAHFRSDSVDLLRATLHETLVVLARQFASAHRVAAQRPTHRPFLNSSSSSSATSSIVIASPTMRQSWRSVPGI